MEVLLADMEVSLAVGSLALVFTLFFFLIFIWFEVSVLEIIWSRSDPYRVIDNTIIFFAIQALLSFALIILVDCSILKQHGTGMGDILSQISVTDDADTTEIIEDKEFHNTGSEIQLTEDSGGDGRNQMKKDTEEKESVAATEEEDPSDAVESYPTSAEEDASIQMIEKLENNEFRIEGSILPEDNRFHIKNSILPD